MQVIAVISPATDAGKTFLATSIGEALAYRKYRTMFIDLDIAVGDAIRVLNLSEQARSLHPTIATWDKFDNFMDKCLRTETGMYVLPRPAIIPDVERMTESIDRLLIALNPVVDALVVDLGANLLSDYWKKIVNIATIVFLITDCDEKAFVRLTEFLNSLKINDFSKWVLTVNAREKKNYYSVKDMVRHLNHSNAMTTMIIPFFPNVERSAVKTITPDSEIAENIVSLVPFGRFEADLSMIRKTSAPTVRQEAQTFEADTIFDSFDTQKFMEQYGTETQEAMRAEFEPAEEQTVLGQEAEQTAGFEQFDFDQFGFDDTQHEEAPMLMPQGFYEQPIMEQEEQPISEPLKHEAQPVTHELQPYSLMQEATQEIPQETTQEALQEATHEEPQQPFIQELPMQPPMQPPGQKPATSVKSTRKPKHKLSKTTSILSIISSIQKHEEPTSEETIETIQEAPMTAPSTTSLKEALKVATMQERQAKEYQPSGEEQHSLAYYFGNDTIAGQKLTAYSFPNEIAPFIQNFSDFEQLKKHSASNPPDVLFITEQSEEVPYITINLRRCFFFEGCLIVAIGKDSYEEAFYSAGGDVCVDALTDEHIETIIRKANRLKTLWHKASKDTLTGVYTRKFLDEYMADIAARSKISGQVFSLAVLDLDDFKKINDTYGHEAGDIVLKSFAQFLLKSFRETDVVFRYGGEEFLVIFPGISDPVPLVERARKKWETEEILLPGGEKIACTFSAGTSGFTGSNASTIFNEADAALYKAKKDGKNRVFAAGQETKQEEGKEFVSSYWAYPMQPQTDKSSVVLKNQPAADMEMPAKREKSSKKRAAKLPLPFAKDSKKEEKSFAYVPVKKQETTGKTIVFVSPCVLLDSSSVCASATEVLAPLRGSISVIDADLNIAGLAPRLKIAGGDWRKAVFSVPAAGAKVYPLDISADVSLEETMLQFEKVVFEARRVSEWVFINAGSHKSQLFKQAAKHADLILWVVSSDPVLLDKARQFWKERPVFSCKEVVLLYGDGEKQDIQDIFIAPCVQIRGVRDKKGVKDLTRLIEHVSIKRGVKVLAVGFDRLPSAPGIVFESFSTVKEASLWLTANRAEGAVLYEGLKDLALLEYDLKQKQIPFKVYGKNSAGKDLFAWLGSVLR